MTITTAQFRQDYPEFASTAQYTPSAVAYWLNLAYAMLNTRRWGNQLDVAAELFAAHNLTLEVRAQAESKNGGIPGQQVGPVNSKSVDKVSIGYDTGSGIEADAGHWNLSIYGTRFIRLAKMFGAGPIQIGIGVTPTGTGLGWSGPNVTPGFSNFG